jgi:serine/threonine-protein kinase RsbW
MFPARQDSLGDARAFLEAFCADCGVGREAGLKLNLVVEELFTNTVKHGTREGSAGPVWITLEAGDGAVRLTYEDHTPPFNPIARARREMLAAQAGEQREGGLGVLLAHGFSISSDYAYLFGRNRIRLALAT